MYASIFARLLPFLIAMRAEQRIVEGPVDTRAKIGETVILRCRVEGQEGAVQWMQNGFGLPVERSRSMLPRFRIEGSASNGEYNLRIHDLHVEDDDLYGCQIKAAGNSRKKISKLARLTVLVEPSKPELLGERSEVNAIATKHIQEYCISREGKPEPIINWFISNNVSLNATHTWLRKPTGNSPPSLGIRVAEERTAHIVEQVERKTSGTFTTFSNISFAPHIEDDGKYLVCMVSHPTYKLPKTVSTVLNVKYPPQIELILDPSSNMRERGSALLHCNIKAKPMNDVVITWSRNGKIINSVKTNTLSFPDLRIDHHLSQYTCHAKNSIGESSESILFNVTYGAQLSSTEQHEAVNPGEKVNFYCDAIGNPTPMILWRKVGDKQILAEGKNLTIDSVQSWQRGEYECEAKVVGFPPVKQIHFLHIKGPPSVSVREEIIANNGEDIEMICEVRGRPQPQDVIWSFEGSAIEYRKPARIHIHQVPRQFGVESKLVIQAVRESDFGLYNCSAFNELGFDFQTIRLIQKSIFDAFVGVLPTSYILPTLIILTVLSIFLLTLLVLKCRFRNESKKPIPNDDVNIKCETYDGDIGYGQFEIVKDQALTDNYKATLNNADFDCQTYSCNGTRMHNCMLQPTDIYPPDEHLYHQSYGSFKSGTSTPIAAFQPLYTYNGSRSLLNAPLEPVTEFIKAEDEDVTPLKNLIRLNDRPSSRMSTHV